MAENMALDGHSKSSGDTTKSKTAWRSKRHVKAVARQGVIKETEIVRKHCENHGYQLSSKVVGTGAYATVFLANVCRNKFCETSTVLRKLEFKNVRVVAIKVIDKASVPAEFLKSFLPRELENHLSLPPHPHVVECYEHFSSDDYEFMVLEYCCNGDLLDRINWHIHRKEKGLPEEMSKKVFYQLCIAVKHCHDYRIVHRDLKCENILLDENDNVKLTDFGFSIRLTFNRALRTACGSFAYAAPEVTSGKSYSGKKADVWSLGVILFAMVNGRLPFPEKKTPPAIAMNDDDDQTNIRRMFKFSKNVSTDCIILINKMLSEEPEKRPSLFKILKYSWVNLDEKRLIIVPSSSASVALQSCETKDGKCLRKPIVTRSCRSCKTSNCSCSSKKPVLNHNTASGDSKITTKLAVRKILSCKQDRQRSRSATTTYAPRPRTVIGGKTDPKKQAICVSKACPVVCASQACPVVSTETDIARLTSSKNSEINTVDLSFTMNQKPNPMRTSTPTITINRSRVPLPKSKPSLLTYRLFDIYKPTNDNSHKIPIVMATQTTVTSDGHETCDNSHPMTATKDETSAYDQQDDQAQLETWNKYIYKPKPSDSKIRITHKDTPRLPNNASKYTIDNRTKFNPFFNFSAYNDELMRKYKNLNNSSFDSCMSDAIPRLDLLSHQTLKPEYKRYNTRSSTPAATIAGLCTNVREPSSKLPGLTNKVPKQNRSLRKERAKNIASDCINQL